MSGEPRILVENVSKRYVKYDDAPLLVTRAMQWRAKTSRSKLWALKDVDFTVAPGECLGVIGHNGSGKSTLLRLLAGVTGPTEGRVKVRGRIAPLISVGVGFHQELTGRENVYANGIILGLTRAEIEDRFAAIVDFAEIGPFIDTPVKFYSTGMFMRLGFAVSVMADPQVLLVDEVLSVGDIGFQLKCLDRMTEIQAAGTTLVIVSHNLGAVRRMCDRTIVLHEGTVRHDGDTVEAISLLHHLLRERRDLENPLDYAEGSPLDDAGDPESFALVGTAGTPTRNVRSDEVVRLVMDVRFRRSADDAIVGIMVFDEHAVIYQDTSPVDVRYSFERGTVARVEAEFQPRLAAGSYMVQLALVRPDGDVVARSVPMDFYVDTREGVKGLADLGARFSVEGGERVGVTVDSRVDGTSDKVEGTD